MISEIFLCQSERVVSCQDVSRVIDVMEHALFDLKPKTRYLVPGGNGYIDWFIVRTMAYVYAKIH